MSNLKPDFYLGSSEHTGELVKARKCFVREKVFLDKVNEYLLIEIDPPIIGQNYGLGQDDIRDIIIAPHFEGSTLFPINEWPMLVYIFYAKKGRIIASETVKASDLVMLGWGEL